jgi:hypothetical protein
MANNTALQLGGEPSAVTAITACYPAITMAHCQGCELTGSRGSHSTPWHPVEDHLDPLQIGKAP